MNIVGIVANTVGIGETVGETGARPCATTGWTVGTADTTSDIGTGSRIAAFGGSILGTGGRIEGTDGKTSAAGIHIGPIGGQ
jgi:hypothetical protein